MWVCWGVVFSPNFWSGGHAVGGNFLSPFGTPPPVPPGKKPWKHRFSHNMVTANLRLHKVYFTWILILSSSQKSVRLLSSGRYVKNISIGKILIQDWTVQLSFVLLLFCFFQDQTSQHAQEVKELLQAYNDIVSFLLNGKSCVFNLRVF